jgi:hypothetical protein
MAFKCRTLKVKHEIRFMAEEIITQFTGALYTLAVVKP